MFKRDLEGEIIPFPVMDLPPDLVKFILVDMDLHSMYNLCQTNSWFWRLCHQQPFLNRYNEASYIVKLDRAQALVRRIFDNTPFQKEYRHQLQKVIAQKKNGEYNWKMNHNGKTVVITLSKMDQIVENMRILVQFGNTWLYYDIYSSWKNGFFWLSVTNNKYLIETNPMYDKQGHTSRQKFPFVFPYQELMNDKTWNLLTSSKEQ